jgi:hypothetical protein
MMGYGGDKINRTAVVLTIGIVLFVALGASGVYSISANSTSGLFNISLGNIWLNWTNLYLSNITLEIIDTATWNTSITFINGTTGINGNYSQRDFYGPSSPYSGMGKYTSGACFHVNSINDSPLRIFNATGGEYINVSNNMTASDTNIFTIIHYALCPPGRYWGPLVLHNTTNNTLENISINMTIDVPITTSNIINSSFAGTLYGRLPQRANSYHSYYFNTNNVTNGSSLLMNMYWPGSPNQNLDVYLFDNSSTPNLLAKSVEMGLNESLYYGYIAPNQMYELRIYGNASSSQAYTGLVYFSKLNASDTGNTSTRLGEIDLGTLDTSLTKNNGNITIENLANQTIPTVTIGYDLYREQTFSGSGDNNFSLVVPQFIKRIEVDLNYSSTSVSNCTLLMYNPSHSLLNMSAGDSKNGNVTFADRYERLTIGASNITEGLWTLNVSYNHTSAAPTYDITVKYYINTNWLSGNGTSFMLNSSKQPNSSRTFYFNFTVPSQNNVMDGTYKGYVSFGTNLGGQLQVPFTANVSTSVLLANNTFNNKTIWIDHNVGDNETINVYIDLNNTGQGDMTFLQSTNSSDKLRYSTYYINFTYDSPTTILAGGTDSLNVTLSLNTLGTSDVEGIYTGWIYINTSESRPYTGFNLTIKVNVTDNILLTVNSVKDFNGDDFVSDPTTEQNVTIDISVVYLNGTVVNDLLISNLNISLVEPNTSYTIPENHLKKQNASNLLFTGGSYLLNISIPGNKSGGWYKVEASADFLRGGHSFDGTDSSKRLLINKPGLYVSLSRTSLSISEGTTSSTYLNMSVMNYGVAQATGKIGLDFTDDRSDCSYITFGRPDDADPDYRDDDNNPDFDEWEWDDIVINPNGSTGWYRWKFSTANVSADQICTLKVNSSNPLLNNKTFTITIREIEGTDDGSPGTGTGTGDDDTPDTEYNYSTLITDYPSRFDVALGGSNSTNITVKNDGNMSTAIKVSVLINDGITASVTPDSYYIPHGKTRNFTITFNVSNSSTLGEHSGTLKAYVSLDTTKHDTRTFTFNVLSTTERETEIEDSYLDYSDVFDGLVDNFTAIRDSGLIPATNLSAVEILINDTIQLFLDIKSAIDDGDYATAESLMADINSTINRVKSEIEELEADKETAAAVAAGGLWVWIVVGIIIAAVAGLFVYMMLPAEGYSLKSGYRPRNVPVSERLAGMGMGRRPASLKDKIKEFFRKLFRRNKNNPGKSTKSTGAQKKYASGYQKQGPAGYKFKK